MSIHAEELELDPEQILRTADFLETYADTLLPSGVEFDESLWASNAEGSGRREEVATALQQAAQWRSLVDVPSARSLFVRAGRHYWAIGRPFGLFLLAASWEDEDALLSATREGVRIWVESDQDSLRGQSIKASLQHPQQQAYLMLACAGNSRIIEQLPGLSKYMANSDAARSGAPMGALGTPTHLRWAMSSSLMRATSNGAVLEAMSETAVRYHSAVRTARQNSYLWTNGASPVDVMDIDLAGAASIIALRFDEHFILSVIDSSLSSEASRLAKVPFKIGLELAVETEESREALGRARAQRATEERYYQEESDRSAAQADREEAEPREADRRTDEEGGQEMGYSQE